MNTKVKNIIKLFAFPLVGMGMCLTSCMEKDIPVYDESDNSVKNGDALSFTITLDQMGGNEDLAFNPNKADENYIDPDKVRLLFFDNQDRFLFESKSRWIKVSTIAAETGLYSWEVLVPFFTHANDVEDAEIDENFDWDWDLIRDIMTKNSFKIAVLANRPEAEWNLGIMTKDASDRVQTDPSYKPLPSDTLSPYGWYGNHGPYWTKEETLKKTIFDLHHCQADPVYEGKNWDNTGNGIYVGFYDHIAEMHGTTPWMGASSSWVDWGDRDNVRPEWTKWNSIRMAKNVSKDHPIPMYGIQEFAPITKWEEGTTFRLNRNGEETDKDGNPIIDKSISLLRSVVKVELIIPSTIKLDYALLGYANIYARCEPADTWDPTDEIWVDAEKHDEECEWRSIYNYGPISTNDPNISGRNVFAYQQKLSWLYGIWLEKDWPFTSDNSGKTGGGGNFDATKVVAAGTNTPYPKIFNSMIQRNNNVFIPETMRYDDGKGYTHYIAYMGERNVNDPSNLSNIVSTSNGNPTVFYWRIHVNGRLYNIPLNDNPNVYPGLDGDANFGYERDATSGEMVPIPPGGSGNSMGEYERAVQSGSIKNWPLVRNHVYRLYLNAPNYQEDHATRSSGTPIQFSARTEMKRSKTISFRHDWTKSSTVQIQDKYQRK